MIQREKSFQKTHLNRVRKLKWALQDFFHAIFAFWTNVRRFGASFLTITPNGNTFRSLRGGNFYSWWLLRLIRNLTSKTHLLKNDQFMSTICRMKNIIMIYHASCILIKHIIMLSDAPCLSPEVSGKTDYSLKINLRMYWCVIRTAYVIPTNSNSSVDE